MRISQAQFARLLGVSRTSVSRWVKKSFIQVGADGRLNPVKAFQCLVQNIDPARSRASFVQAAAQDMADLRERVAALETHAEHQAGRIAYLDSYIDELDRAWEEFLQIVEPRWSELATLPAAEVRSAMESVMEEALLSVSADEEAEPPPAASSVDVDSTSPDFSADVDSGDAATPCREGGGDER